MKATLKVEASGLVAVATRLRAAAAQLEGSGEMEHPPLAADQTSVAAAARLSAAAAALQSAAAAQAAALVDIAEHLDSIAAGFTVQETVSTAAVQALTSSAATVGSPSVLAPVPPVDADARPPLTSPTTVDGEAVARQLYAGSASAGSVFTQSWRSRSAAAATAHDVIRDVLSTLPEVWNSSSGSETATRRLLRQADAVTRVAARAAALADQADRHARGYSGAVAATPKAAQFDAVRSQLRQALEANATFPGQYTPMVSSLIAQQGALRQQALNAQSEYHGQTEASTAPVKDEMSPELAGQSPASGRCPHAEALPGMLGAVGGMIGGAVSSAAQLPQSLLQTGQQLAQAATQGLSGLATSAASGTDSAATGFDAPEEVSRSGGLGGQSDRGATTPAGGTDATPVAPSTSSAPPSATTLPQGTPPAATAPAAGPSAVPMGMPMGMLPPPAATDTGRQIAADKKIVVPVMPHTEPVTGRTTPDRLASRPPTENEFS